MTYHHSRVLFRKEDGRAMRFYMPPCEERAILRPLVEHGGGVLSSKSKKDSFRIAVPDKHIHEGGALDPRYIHDCVDKNELLSMNKYKLQAGAKVSDDDLEPAPNIIHLQAKERRGRKQYLLSEDKAIINYLLNTNSYNHIGGNVLWKKMEFHEAVPGHPWQSLKHRYRLHILPNIHTYSLKDHQVAKLLKCANLATGENQPKECDELKKNSQRNFDDTNARENSKKNVISPISGWLSKNNRKSRKTKGNNLADVETIDDFDRELLSLASNVKEKHRDGKGQSSLFSDNEIDTQIIDVSTDEQENRHSDKRKSSVEDETNRLEQDTSKVSDVSDKSSLPPPLQKSGCVSANKVEEIVSSSDEFSRSTHRNQHTDHVSKDPKSLQRKLVLITDGRNSEVSPLKRNLRSNKYSSKKSFVDRNNKELRSNSSSDEPLSPPKRQLRSKATVSKSTAPRKIKRALQSIENDSEISDDADDFTSPSKRNALSKLVLPSPKKKLTSVDRRGSPVRGFESETTRTTKRSKKLRTSALYEDEEVSHLNSKHNSDSSESLDNSKIPQKRCLRSLGAVCDETKSEENNLPSPEQHFEIVDSQKESNSIVRKSVPSDTSEELKSLCHAERKSEANINKSNIPVDNATGQISEYHKSVSVPGVETANCSKVPDPDNSNISETNQEVRSKQKSSVFPVCYSLNKKAVAKRRIKRSPKKSMCEGKSSSKSVKSSSNSDTIPPNGIPADKQRQSYQKLGSSLREFMMADTQETQSAHSQTSSSDSDHIGPLDNDNIDQAEIEAAKKCHTFIQEVADCLEIPLKVLSDVCHWVSGNLDEAIFYILNGKTMNGSPVWKLADDTMLQNGGEAEYQALEQKYGEQQVLLRQQYLAQNLLQET